MSTTLDGSSARCPYSTVGPHLFRVSAATGFVRLTSWDLDLLSSEQTRIQRTAARSEHRQCGRQRRKMDKRPGFCGM
jgi:spore coat protein CotH